MPISAKAEFEYLYDKPYDDKKKVRVAGPFTVESLSPHRVLGVDENDELIDQFSDSAEDYAARQTFPQMILENLRTAGVQQAHKDARIPLSRSRRGPEISSRRTDATLRVRAPRRSSGAPRSSSGRSLAPSRAPTWWPPLGRLGTAASTCSSPAPSIMRRMPRSSASSAVSRSSRRA